MWSNGECFETVVGEAVSVAGHLWTEDAGAHGQLTALGHPNHAQPGLHHTGMMVQPLQCLLLAMRVVYT